MRRLEKDEISKRGCEYCSNIRHIKGRLIRGEYMSSCDVCKYKECPYHELDDYVSFNDYLKTCDFPKAFL